MLGWHPQCRVTGRVSWAASTQCPEQPPCPALLGTASTELSSGRDPEVCERNEEGEWRAQEGEAGVPVRRERRTPVCRELSFAGSAAHKEPSFILP